MEWMEDGDDEGVETVMVSGWEWWVVVMGGENSTFKFLETVVGGAEWVVGDGA